MATKTATEVQSQILIKAEEDTAFRARLIDDPKGVIQAETGLILPDDVMVLVEETLTIAQEAVPSIDTPLTEEELVQVMGGVISCGIREDTGTWEC